MAGGIAVAALAPGQRALVLQLFEQAFQLDPRGAALDAEGLGDVALGSEGGVIGDPLLDLVFRG